MSDDTSELIVDRIVEAIDCSTMLGAGWDCLSQAAKDRFKAKLKKIIDESSSPPVSESV